MVYAWEIWQLKGPEWAVKPKPISHFIKAVSRLSASLMKLEYEMNVNEKCNSQMTCLTVLCGPISHFSRSGEWTVNPTLTTTYRDIPIQFCGRKGNLLRPPLAPVARGFLRLAKFSWPLPCPVHLLRCWGSELPVTLHEGPDPWSQDERRGGVGSENSLYLSGRVSSAPRRYVSRNLNQKHNQKVQPWALFS